MKLIVSQILLRGEQCFVVFSLIFTNMPFSLPSESLCFKNMTSDTRIDDAEFSRIFDNFDCFCLFPELFSGHGKVPDLFVVNFPIIFVSQEVSRKQKKWF